MTSATKPWNGIYRIAAGRGKQPATTTTLRQQDGALTTNLHGTLLHMLRNFTPEDNEADDNESYKQIRALTQEAMDTADNKEFSAQEVGSKHGQQNVNPRTAAIFTDSRISLDSLHNPNNHAFLVEKIERGQAVCREANGK
jgi:hypothetical protein